MHAILGKRRKHAKMGRHRLPSAAAPADLNELPEIRESTQASRVYYNAGADDVHPVWEIAKLHAERLDDPDSGIAYLEQTLRDGEWEQEGASFLMNRLADLNIEHRGDFDAARALLTQIVEIMPKTRFSANATHRIRQLEEEEVQAKLAAQRQEQQLQESGEGEEV